MNLSLTSLLALTLVTHPAAAHPTPAAPAPSGIPIVSATRAVPDYTAGDWVGSTLSGSVGAALGGALGFGTGVLLAGPCHEGPQDSDLFGSCFLHGLGEGVLGALLVAPVTTAGGVTLYNDLRGHRGSYWAALGGSYAGTAAALGVAALAGLDDHGDGGAALSWIALLTLPALGGTVGYYLSRGDDEGGGGGGGVEGGSGGLVDVGRDGAVRLSVPNVTVAPAVDGTTVGVTLLGGAW